MTENINRLVTRIQSSMDTQMIKETLSTHTDIRAGKKQQPGIRIAARMEMY